MNQISVLDEELMSLNYSILHVLRAPLRRIGGFSMLPLNDYSDRLDARVQQY